MSTGSPPAPARRPWWVFAGMALAFVLLVYIPTRLIPLPNAGSGAMFLLSKSGSSGPQLTISDREVAELRSTVTDMHARIKAVEAEHDMVSTRANGP